MITAKAEVFRISMWSAVVIEKNIVMKDKALWQQGKAVKIC